MTTATLRMHVLRFRFLPGPASMVGATGKANEPRRGLASGYSLKTDAVFLSMMAAAIQKSPGQAWGKNGFFLSPTSAWCPVSAVQPSVQSPQAFDTAETGQNRREYPRWFAPKPQPDRRIGVLFLCPHSFVTPRAPPIHHETIFREYRDALQQNHQKRRIGNHQ